MLDALLGRKIGMTQVFDDKGEVHRIDVALTDTVQPDDVIYVRESLF